jgi:protoheme IX farnesyltransferase
MRFFSATKSSSESSVLKHYYSLTKPGIIYGNLVTLLGGFLLASRHAFDVLLLLYTAIGMSLVIACGCVLNNIIDADIDQLMERTKNRLIARGIISVKAALIYAVVLGILGFLLLVFQTNALTVIIAFVGLFFYVVLYSLWFKRHSVFGTLVGGVAGAVPPVIGYLAVTNHFDSGAVILFLILFFWQMPHSYAIAVYRLKDYKAAAIPVLPVKKGIAYTRISMLAYIIAFTVTAVMPWFLGYAGLLYFIVALCIGIVWFMQTLKPVHADNARLWAKKIFLFSVLGITLLSVMMIVH